MPCHSCYAFILLYNFEASAEQATYLGKCKRPLIYKAKWTKCKHPLIYKAKWTKCKHPLIYKAKWTKWVRYLVVAPHMNIEIAQILVLFPAQRTFEPLHHWVYPQMAPQVTGPLSNVRTVGTFLVDSLCQWLVLKPKLRERLAFIRLFRLGNFFNSYLIIKLLIVHLNGFLIIVSAVVLQEIFATHIVLGLHVAVQVWAAPVLWWANGTPGNSQITQLPPHTWQQSNHSITITHLASQITELLGQRTADYDKSNCWIIMTCLATNCWTTMTCLAAVKSLNYHHTPGNSQITEWPWCTWQQSNHWIAMTHLATVKLLNYCDTPGNSQTT